MSRLYAIRPVDGGPIKIGHSHAPAVRFARIQSMSPVPLELLGHVRETHILNEWSVDDQAQLPGLGDDCDSGWCFT